MPNRFDRRAGPFEGCLDRGKYVRKHRRAPFCGASKAESGIEIRPFERGRDCSGMRIFQSIERAQQIAIKTGGDRNAALRESSLKMSGQKGLQMQRREAADECNLER